MNSQERREARYQRRQQARLHKRQQNMNEVGSLDTTLSYNELFKHGKKCCNGVRWKRSTQDFERHLFSKAAVQCKHIKDGTWKPAPYYRFTLSERGKTRIIDAPMITDRMIHKAFTHNVLLPLYTPSMIYNNGASLKGKGLQFSQKCLMNDLHKHFRKYGLEGQIILVDFSKYFPSVPHKELYNRHNQIILDDKTRHVADKIVQTVKGNTGMPLGVEPSQAEMIAFPSALDNYIKCQLSMKCAGHYMDDYYILVPPAKDAKAILNKIIEKATSIGLTVNRSKTIIQPIRKSFKYCKATYSLNETGKLIVRNCRDSLKRARHKLKSFANKRNMLYEDLYCSVNSMFAYFNIFNDHNRLLKLRRFFYYLFNFSSENINEFRKREVVDF